MKLKFIVGSCILACSLVGFLCSLPFTKRIPLQINIELGGKNSAYFRGHTGSIIELVDKQGQTLFGLGVPRSVNTFILNQHYLASFVKNASIKNNLSYLYAIDRPFKDASGSFLRSNAQEVLVCNYADPAQGCLVFDQKNKQFHADLSSKESSLYYKGQIIKFESFADKNKIYIQEKFYDVLPEGSQIYMGAIVNDYMFLGVYIQEKYHLYALKINSDSKALVSSLKLLQATSANEYIYTFGFLKERIIFFTNRGNIYSISVKDIEKNFSPKNKIKTIFENVKLESNQFYSSLNFYDRLLLGHYPDGKLWTYDGVQLINKEVPTVLPQYSPYGREAQSLFLSGGNILVGLWPWSEVWVVSADFKNSTFIRRLIKKPKPTNKTPQPLNNNIEPYDNMIENDDYNAFGQRVTGILGHENLIFFSTSSKRGKYVESAKDKIHNFGEYGKIHVFRTLNDFFIPLGSQVFETTKNQKINLKFYFSDRKYKRGFVEVWVNGALAGKVDNCFDKKLIDGMKVIQGQGIYGAYEGEIISVKIKDKPSFSESIQ